MTEGTAAPLLPSIATERQALALRRQALLVELATVDSNLELLDRLEAWAAAPAEEAERKPRADVRALTLARFTEGRALSADAAATTIAHETGRKPSEVRRALKRLIDTGEVVLDGGVFRRPRQEAAE